MSLLADLDSAVFYYTSADCTSGEVYGEELGHCEQLGTPFKGVKVVCP